MDWLQIFLPKSHHRHPDACLRGLEPQEDRKDEHVLIAKAHSWQTLQMLRGRTKIEEIRSPASAVLQHFSAEKPTVSCGKLIRNLNTEGIDLAVVHLQLKMLLELLLAFEFSHSHIKHWRSFVREF